MILADKIITLRKQKGYSQEELAERMNVSRQAVSKWESAQAMPDIEKILLLSKLFNVTTDYLLKDEIESADLANSKFTEESKMSDAPSVVQGVKISEEDAGEYLAWKKRASWLIALAACLCILSVIPLLTLTATRLRLLLHISEVVALVIGLAVLFVCIACSVAVFIYTGLKNSVYEYIENASFVLEEGVRETVREKHGKHRNLFIRNNIIGTCLCILSPLTLILFSLMEQELLALIGLALIFVMVGIAVLFYIVGGVRYASTQRLLKEGEFSIHGQKKNKLEETVNTIYWSIAVAVYLGWSFVSMDWHITWILWPIAAVLSGGVSALCHLIADKPATKKED